MRQIQRLIASLLYIGLSVITNTIVLLCLIVILLWGISQIKPVISLISQYTAEYQLSEVGLYIVNSLPAMFIGVVIFVFTLLGIHYVNGYLPYSDTIWDRLPKSIKGEDIELPKWLLRLADRLIIRLQPSANRLNDWLDKKTHGAWGKSISKR